MAEVIAASCAGRAVCLAGKTVRERRRRSAIGQLSVRDEAAWIAEVLTDIEVDELARLQLVDGLRGVLDA